MFVNGFSVALTATFAAREMGEIDRSIELNRRPERERRDASRSSRAVIVLLSALAVSLVLTPSLLLLLLLLSITDSGTGWQ